MTIKKSVILLLAVMALFVFMGCASDPEPEAKELDTVKKTVILDHKGASLDLGKMPTWIETYIYEGVRELEAMDKYQDSYCFVAEADDPNLEAAKMWAKNFNMAQDIAGTISTRVESVFEGAATNSDDDYAKEFTSLVSTYINAEVAGARLAEEWWVQRRYYDVDNENDYEDIYTAFLFYTVPRSVLDDQVEGAVEKILEGGDLSAEKVSVLEAAKALVAEKGLPSAE